MEECTIRAVIFDMDGVISDTQGTHAQVESELLKENGIIISPEEITMRFSGVKSVNIFKTLSEEAGKPIANPDALAEEHWRRMTERTDHGIWPVPGTKETAEKLKGAGLRLGVASASRLAFISFVLESLHMQGIFDAVTSSEEVMRGKPAPDVFLLAAERLGIPPSECVVIEDGISGMTAAKEAGMYCIGLVRGGIAADEIPADAAVSNLREFPWEQLHISV